MGNDAKIVGQNHSAPPEWIVALRDVVFSGLDNFKTFLTEVGATLDQLEFDAVTGRSKGLNGFFSTLQDNGKFKLTGYGISLLHQATNGNFQLVTSAHSKHGSVDSKHSLSPPTLPSRDVSGSNTGSSTESVGDFS